jgi:hypothetical protein
MKVPAKYYREIEYVLVSELPDVQQQLLKQHTEIDFIKILIEDKVTGPCVQYKQYNDWYQNIYSKAFKNTPESKSLPVKHLAWGEV